MSGRRTLAWLFGLCLFALLSSPARIAKAEYARPAEAPWLDTTPTKPPLPPEYRKEERAGMHFAYHPSARTRLRPLMDSAEAVRRALSEDGGRPLLSALEVRVAFGSEDFARVVPKGAPEGKHVLALGQLQLLVLDLRPSTSASAAQARFRRGLAYLALDEAAGARALPHWFRLGYALQFSEPSALMRSRSLWWASMHDRLLPLADLDVMLEAEPGHDSLAAAEAANYVQFLSTGPRRAAFSLLLGASAKRGFDDALRTAYQESPETLELSWLRELAKHKVFLPVLGASAALWLLVAGASRLRRRRKPQVDAAPIELTADLPQEPAEAPSKRKRRASKRRAKVHLPEPEVPKVSHDGRWHTLH